MGQDGYRGVELEKSDWKVRLEFPAPTGREAAVRDEVRAMLDSALREYLEQRG